MKLKLIILVHFAALIEVRWARTLNSLDCASPPPMVDPHDCCLDPAPNAIAKVCAKKYGLPVAGEPPQASTVPPSIDSTVCFAECVLKSSKFMTDTGAFDINTMSAAINKEYKNDTAYANVMINAFKTCAASANKKFEAIKLLPIGETIMRSRCSALPGVILGCTYTEYFKNCPANRWVSQPMCEAAKQYVKNCVQ